jgi:Leucine-rich repeat (LRR) protein
MSDFDIIRQIEKKLKVYLSQLGSIIFDRNSYTLNRSEQVISLVLRYCNIIDISDLIYFFKTLTNLTHLSLIDNKIYHISPLNTLTNLKELNLSGNEIRDIYTLTSLTNLEQLNLSGNKIEDISSLKSLTNLKQLNLSGNQIIDISPLKSLINLKELDLYGNQVRDIYPLEALTNLKQLILSYNPIQELPSWITDFKLGIQWEEYGNDGYINFYDNPLKTPPPEIVKQGKEAIRNYFSQLKEQKEDYLYEAKLLIIGEPGAGKTTLAKKIENSEYKLCKNEKSTEGIEVIRYEFPLENNRTFRINIWDFGGQEIYHATHQFFLTKRSLYALVADSRKEDTDFYYWLNAVELLTDNSPLLIVKNEKQDRQREIPERQLRGQFTNLKEILAVNLATKRGLPEILKEIQHRISNLPHIGSALPKTWVRVREELENDDRNHISLEQYLDICEKNGFTKLQDKLQLSGYLHDLGVCLHFQEDPLLKKTVILKPEWGTYAVYKVLDNKEVIRNFGRFTKSDLTKIWNEDRYACMEDELLRLMLNFQLCYQIPDSRDTYIAPQLLTENQPDYEWNETDNLILRYTYEFMPKGIITRFIVMMHRWIREQAYVWKSGVILKKDDTFAEVIEYYGKREIRIRVTGKNKRDFMTIITHELDKIHHSYNRLKYNKMIPCNCVTCKGNQEPHFYPSDELREFISNGQNEIQCRKKPYKMVNVRGLIDDVSAEHRTDVRDEKNRKSQDIIFNINNIGGNVNDSAVVAGNQNATEQISRQ